MKYKSVQNLKEEQFRRLTGVQRETFNRMVEIVNQALPGKKSKKGRPNRLCVQDMVLMTLEYLREYRTYFHISTNYGLSESNCYKKIRFVEDALIKSGDFTLPGRKALLKSDMEYEVLLVDATESPIQRPKKNRNSIIQGRKKSTL